MAVRSFLNPYGAYVDGLERGNDFAYRQASQAQDIRDKEDEYVSRLLRRPAEQSLLENQARVSGFNANFLGDTYDNRVATTGYNTEQDRIKSVADQLRYEFDQLANPYKIKSVEADSRISKANADFGEQTVDSRVQAAKLNPLAVQAGINATGANTGYTAIRSQGLQNNIVQEEADRNALIIASAKPTVQPNGIIRLTTVNGFVDISEDQYLSTLKYVRDRQADQLRSGTYRTQAQDQLNYDANYE